MVKLSDIFKSTGTEAPPYPAAQIANFFIQKSGGTFTPLKLQKLVYLAQMVYVGRNDAKSLIQEPIEAWNYGPVVSSLYANLRDYGSGPVNCPISFVGGSFTSDISGFLEEIYQNFGSLSSSRLVALTHATKGAWDRNYREGVKNIVIPLEDIADEFKELTK